MTVHFGGRQGAQIRRYYRALQYEADGERRQLLPAITDDSPSFTFSNPTTGLLNATQFTQPALCLMEKAAFEDMRARGLVSEGSAFAGHSLGEYAALASVGDVLPLETLLDVVFYRGLTMQAAVKRDAAGRSNYGMLAVNPSRVSPDLTDAALRRLVEAVGRAQQSGALLEIVNYNVENQQYVLAGELKALEALTQLLNYLAHQNLTVADLTSRFGEEALEGHLRDLLDGVLGARIAAAATVARLIRRWCFMSAWWAATFQT
jgi:fatty acid synthase subunit beta